MKSKIIASLAFVIMLTALLGVFAGAAANTASYKTEDVSKKQPTVIYTSSEQPTNTGSGTIAYPSAYGLVELSPEKQFSDTGNATYKVVVRDLHSLPSTSNNIQVSTARAYTYKLSFSSAQGLSGEFENDEITLGVGETRVVLLKVFTNSETTESTKDKTKIFSVFVTGEDAKEKVNGILVLGKGNEQPAPSGTSNKPLEPSGNSFFVGEGIAINGDSSNGKIIDLRILGKDKEIQGKMAFGGEVLRLKGTASNDIIQFNLYKTNDDSVSIGEFNGNVEKYEELLLIKGTLKFQFEIFTNPNNIWDVIAFSKRQSVFKPVEISESSNQATETVSKDNVISVTETKEAETTETAEPKEFYITPKGVEKRLFGFIPNKYWGEKVLEVEVTDKEGKTTTTAVKENSETQIGDYKVGVGSLESENYEISVSKV